MLQVGHAKTEILPPGEPHLIGMYARKPRIGRVQRDPLHARALALAQGDTRAVLVACDLLCVSEELHRAVGQAVGELGPERILLAGTHTHCSFGGFFSSPATAAMLGAPRQEVFDFLVDRLAAVIRAALQDLAPAEAAFGRAELPGLTASRREAGGPHDDWVSVLRLSRKQRRPIHLVTASGHPVVVSEREPNAISADYPGALCAALEADGIAPLFFSAALGGVSILFPEFKMGADRHLALLTGLLTRAHARAIERLEPVSAEPGPLRVEAFRVAHGPHRSRAFSGLGRIGAVADRLLAPGLGWLERAGGRALPNPNGVPAHLIGLGDWVLLGTAAELGVSVVHALRAAADDAGLRAQVVSLADGYAGYTHLPAVYGRWPEKGYRFMALYENALGLFGHDLGDRIVAEFRGRLP